MSAKVKLTCKTHPKYKAIREPKVNCASCSLMYEIVRSNLDPCYPDTFRVERTK